MRALVVGAHRLGRVLAGDLVHTGHDVRVLDCDSRRLAELPAGLQDRALHGSPLDHDTLANAVAGCDALAAVSADDAFNAVVALGARRELRVPLAVAVIANPARAEALTGLGVHVVCPTTRTAHDLQATLLRSDLESELVLGDVTVHRAQAPGRLAGRAVRELERAGRLLVVAIERHGRVMLATPDVTVLPGDIVHVAATHRDDVADLVRD